MAVVPDKTIAAAAKAAGFPADQVATAVAVALAESGGNATATNRNSNGTTDFGLWQINSIHPESRGNWQDPATNARAARAVWGRAGNSWRPWYAWRDGKHLPYMARGAAAAAEAGGITGAASDGSLNPGAGADTTESRAGVALAGITDPDSWKRAGLISLGALLLIAALVAILYTLGTRAVIKSAVGGALRDSLAPAKDSS